MPTNAASHCKGWRLCVFIRMPGCNTKSCSTLNSAHHYYMCPMLFFSIHSRFFYHLVKGLDHAGRRDNATVEQLVVKIGEQLGLSITLTDRFFRGITSWLLLIPSVTLLMFCLLGTLTLIHLYTTMTANNTYHIFTFSFGEVGWVCLHKAVCWWSSEGEVPWVRLDTKVGAGRIQTCSCRKRGITGSDNGRQDGSIQDQSQTLQARFDGVTEEVRQLEQTNKKLCATLAEVTNQMGRGRKRRIDLDTYSERHKRQLLSQRITTCSTSLGWLEEDGLVPLKIEVRNQQTGTVEVIELNTDYPIHPIGNSFKEAETMY